MDQKNDAWDPITVAAMGSMLETMSDILFIKDAQLVYLGASRSFAQLVGLDTPALIIGKTDDQIFHDPELVRRYVRDDRAVLHSGKPMASYIEPISIEGQGTGYSQTSKFPLFNEAGEVIGLYGLARDVTQEYRARLNYEQQLRALFELPPDAMGAALFDITNGRLIDTRVRADYAQQPALGGDLSDWIVFAIASVAEDEEARDFYRSCTATDLQAVFDSGRRRLHVEYRRICADGSARWVHNDLHLLSDPVTGNLCVMSILRDIDEAKQAAIALARSAQRDALTDVFNREATMKQIEEFLAGEGANDTHLLFMVDVDNFKLVNDNLGHRAGDEALVHIASAISGVFRTSDIVGRIGGDEFFILMKHADDMKVAQKRAAALVAALQYECSDGCTGVPLSGSVGISRYAGDGKSLAQLYAEADDALYRAKRHGKNHYVFAEPVAEVWEEKAPLNAVNLRMLLENANAALFQTELNEQGEVCVTYSSHSLFAGAAQGVAPSGTRGENFWEILIPEDKIALTQAIRAATADGTVLNCSCRVTAPHGRVEWRHVCGSPLPDLGDGIQRMIHVATDITRQMEVEAELREKNSIVDVAMRNTDINLWYFDYESTTCQLTASCQKAHNMPGVEQLEHFPKCLLDMGYVREDSYRDLQHAYNQLRYTGQRTEVDVWFRTADGAGWWCERDTLSPLVGADGRVTRCIGIGKDVTSEKRLEEKYETFGAYRRLAEKNTRVSFRMNLTSGWFGDCVSSTPQVRDLYPVDTPDGFFHLFRQRIATEEDLARFDAIFSREKLLEAFAQGESLRSIEFRFTDERGMVIWLRLTTEMMRNPITGDVEALLYTFDIDQEKCMQLMVEKLLDNDYEFLGLIDIVSGRLMVFGPNADAPDMAHNGGLYDEEARKVLPALILEEYWEEGLRNMALSHVVEALGTSPSYTCSFPARDFAHIRGGRKQWKFNYLDDSRSKILITRTDITNLYTAEYDSLTGLYNRDAFYRRAREVLDANPHTEFLVLRFDIDRFKAYNEVYGGQSGDRLLAAVGRIVREGVWPQSTVCGRLEADHFVALLPGAGFVPEAWQAGQIHALASVTEGYRLTSSVGVYRVVDPWAEVSLMCDRALMALRTVKESYSQKIAWYNESLWAQLLHEQSLTDDMESALDTEQFVLHFQPIVDYRQGILVGAEALVRWQHPTRGLISPGDFIPLFEKNGFILRLDAFVWEKSCAMLRHWLDAGMNPVPISVNVSRCNLYDPGLLRRFTDLLSLYRLPVSLLNLEITESAYMDDPEQLMSVVGELRKVGFTVEMDDFGSGYSSLNMLREMPVDILKLDTRFISESESDERAGTILSAVIQMAHHLGLTVIAEGVETLAQANSLHMLGCAFMQGYHFSRPLPAAQFEGFLDGHPLPFPS